MIKPKYSFVHAIVLKANKDAMLTNVLKEAWILSLQEETAVEITHNDKLYVVNAYLEYIDWLKEV